MFSWDIDALINDVHSTCGGGAQKIVGKGGFST